MHHEQGKGHSAMLRNYTEFIYYYWFQFLSLPICPLRPFAQL